MLHHAIQEPERVSELALSIAWHAGLTRELSTIDGGTLRVIFPGHWTHGFGPDFLDAMLEDSDGRLLRGTVELHHRASDWIRHGHHTDPAYNDVILHIVTNADLAETRRQDGTTVPVAVLHIGETQLRAVEQRRPDLWSQFGGSVCAPNLAAEQPARIRQILQHLGDTRFEERVARFEGELALQPPAAVLIPALFDAFGYTRNRDPMRTLAQALDWPTFTHRLNRRDASQRTDLILALLLGLGGWLPLSPTHASLAGLTPTDVERIERRWSDEYRSWSHAVMPGNEWATARVRPANHPVTRIATLASLLGRHGDHLLPVLVDAIRHEASIPETLQRMIADTAPPLGTDRSIAISGSVILPFSMAYARSNRDDELEDASQRSWSKLAGGTMAQPARRARQQVSGDTRITALRERGAQGLLYLDRNYCGPRRCYECPIARAVVADELAGSDPAH